MRVAALSFLPSPLPAEQPDARRARDGFPCRPAGSIGTTRISRAMNGCGLEAMGSTPWT